MEFSPEDVKFSCDRSHADHWILTDLIYGLRPTDCELYSMDDRLPLQRLSVQFCTLRSVYSVQARLIVATSL